MKKGAIKMVVAMIIALVVLVVVLFIFRNQVSKALEGYTSIQDKAQGENEGSICNTLIGGRSCVSTEECEGETATSPEGGWSDCKSPKVCCELY